MTEKGITNDIKQIQDKIKPILEDLTLNVLKKKPDNIVSNNHLILISLFLWLNIYKKLGIIKMI